VVLIEDTELAHRINDKALFIVVNEDFLPIVFASMNDKQWQVDLISA
jgi:hypothetical protein